MPQLGESVVEGTVIRWLKQPGETVEKLEPLLEIATDKIDTEEWLEAHRVAHSVGLGSNVTIMFGAVENPIHWARHMVRTRDLQKENEAAGRRGFTEFVGLPFVHMASPIYLQRGARRGPTFRENLLVHAVARLAYRDLIPNVQASWVKIGLDGVSQLLNAGCNDLGGGHLDCGHHRRHRDYHGGVQCNWGLKGSGSRGSGFKVP